MKSYHFEEIIKKGYSLDIIYMLRLLKSSYDISDMCKNSVKIKNLYTTIIRKELYSEETNKLTITGDELLLFSDSEIETVFKKKSIEVNDFDEWWKIFPSNNGFTHKGVEFKVTRSFISKKPDCKKLFEKYINEKMYTAKEIINATKYDINIRKNESVKSRENQLKFLQNTYTYLFQKTFEGFIGLIAEDENDNTDSYKTSVDI